MVRLYRRLPAARRLPVTWRRPAPIAARHADRARHQSRTGGHEPKRRHAHRRCPAGHQPVVPARCHDQGGEHHPGRSPSWPEAQRHLGRWKPLLLRRPALRRRAGQSARQRLSALFRLLRPGSPALYAHLGPEQRLWHTVDADHGRIETRTATVSTDIAWLQADHQWPGLAAVGKIVRMRETAAKTTTETAYYLLSTALSGQRFNEVAREHWGVENRLHWRLDVVMNEDQDRTRLGNAPNNLAVLRHMALNVMQKDGSRESLRGKFQRAAWDNAYLARLLTLF